MDPARIRLEWISASEAPKFAQVVRDFVKEVIGMGPNPFSHREEERGVHSNSFKDIHPIREGKAIN
jgi:hypothetical protein